MLQLKVAQHAAALVDAAGLISITASHNDAAWNGLMLFGRSGSVPTSPAAAALLQCIRDLADAAVAR